VTAQKESDLSYIVAPIVHNDIITVKIRGQLKAVVLASLRPKPLQHFHENHGHPSRRKTVKLISTHYYWPNIIADIKTHVSSCKTCQLVKHKHTLTPGHYVLPETVDQPLDLIGLDTIVMGPSANKTKAKYIQVFIDHHSRYIWAFPTPRNSAATIVSLFTQLLQSGIKPLRLLNCHLSFQSNALKDFCFKNQIKHVFSTPYRPQTNGIVKR
jgi:transposase InsO family protein